MSEGPSSEFRFDLQAANQAVIGSLGVTPKKSGSRLPRWILRTIAGLAATILGVWVGTQFWPHWVDYRDRQPPKPDAPFVAQPAIVPAAVPDVGTSLLGTDASVSEKPLLLVLVATVPGRTLQESTASLGTDPRNPQTYAGGAVLANGALIEQIEADRVVLRLNGRRSTLTIDRDASARVAMNSVVNDQRTKAGYPVLTPTFADANAGVTSIGGRQKKQGREENISKSREDLSEFLRPQPVFEKERMTGLKLLPGTNPSRMTALGVEPGDVIRSVEGKMIESDAAWQKIDDALSSGASIVVGIERNGSLMSISLDGALLAPTESASLPTPTAQIL